MLYMVWLNKEIMSFFYYVKQTQNCLFTPERRMLNYICVIYKKLFPYQQFISFVNSTLFSHLITFPLFFPFLFTLSLSSLLPSVLSAILVLFLFLCIPTFIHNTNKPASFFNNVLSVILELLVRQRTAQIESSQMIKQRIQGNPETRTKQIFFCVLTSTFHSNSRDQIIVKSAFHLLCSQGVESLWFFCRSILCLQGCCRSSVLF